MDQEKHIPPPHERELGHELVASGDAIVVDNVGTEADRRDMYRMGKVQQMQVSRLPPPRCSKLKLNIAAHLQLVPNVQLQYDLDGLVGNKSRRFSHLDIQWGYRWNDIRLDYCLGWFSLCLFLDGRDGLNGANEWRPVPLGMIRQES